MNQPRHGQPAERPETERAHQGRSEAEDALMASIAREEREAEWNDEAPAAKPWHLGTPAELAEMHRRSQELDELARRQDALSHDPETRWHEDEIERARRQSTIEPAAELAEFKQLDL